MNRFIGVWLIAVWLMAGAASASGDPSIPPAPSPRVLIESAHQATTSLTSYTCKLTSITRHKGNNGRYLEEKTNILTYVYRSPDHIRLEWLSPRRKRGQLAVYNGESLRAAPTWMPFAVTVDPDSPTGMDDFHHPIYRSDLATLMDTVMEDMPKVTEESYEGLVTAGQRKAHRVVLHTDEKRVVLMIDSENFLPLAIEQFDRETGVLFDGGYFEDYRLNPSLNDSQFDL